MYVCICHAVTESVVTGEIALGAGCPRDIAARTGAGTGCGSCVRRICELLRTHQSAYAEPAASAA